MGPLGGGVGVGLAVGVTVRTIVGRGVRGGIAVGVGVGGGVGADGVICRASMIATTLSVTSKVMASTSTVGGAWGVGKGVSSASSIATTVSVTSEVMASTSNVGAAWGVGKGVFRASSVATTLSAASKLMALHVHRRPNGRSRRGFRRLGRGVYGEAAKGRDGNDYNHSNYGCKSTDSRHSTPQESESKWARFPTPALTYSEKNFVGA